jgi:hypothetical protein
LGLGSAAKGVVLAFFFALPLVFLLRAGAQSSSAPDSGTFRIFANQELVGTEEFRIVRDASGWETKGELRLNTGQAPATETAILRLDSNLRPKSYERLVKSPKTGRLTAQIGPSETSLVSVTPEGSKEQVFYLPANFLVILDTNFFHHYALLLHQYDQDRGGRQAFNVFIPQEALPGTIDLEYAGKESVTVGATTEELDHYRCATEELQMEIWATAEKTIQRLWIPAANVEVVRQ